MKYSLYLFYDVFNSIMELDQSTKLKKVESFTATKNGIRDILQVNKLTETREYNELH